MPLTHLDKSIVPNGFNSEHFSLHFRIENLEQPSFGIIAVGGKTQIGLTSTVEVLDSSSGRLKPKFDIFYAQIYHSTRLSVD